MNDAADLMDRLHEAATWKEQKPYQDAGLFREAAQFIQALRDQIASLRGRISQLEDKLAGDPRRSPEERIAGYGEILRKSVERE